MSQASQTSNVKKSYVCHCGNLAMLRTSHTDTNPGRQFFNCAIGACSFFNLSKLSPELETSNFQGFTKFQILERLQNSEENRDLLLSLFKEAEEQRIHFKGLLKDTEKDRDQLKQKLILAEEKEKGLKIILYGLLLVVAFWKCVTGMQ
ncbi:hypothetical protein R3W88_021214 [Solanum pinnatisectum]|uniref:GRF-type domain-containing protein n=1 Tax=Solanum pinnatisectum TaxID=50273 RepID=A0AAV9LR87_9SOLN|nr:hypothetical protein R3W88_021214 [Solanum pinnatisectum]